MSSSILQRVFRYTKQLFGVFPETKRLAGKDIYGTAYYEDSGSTKKGILSTTARWFEPKEKENFEVEIPAEWEAWLRKRRLNPPTEEEISKSMSIAEMKKINARNLEELQRLERGVEENDPLDFSRKDKRRPFPKHEDRI